MELGRGLRPPQVCKKLGISEQTYYRWRKEYGGLRLDQAKRLKTLEQENARLKRVVADQALEPWSRDMALHRWRQAVFLPGILLFGLLGQGQQPLLDGEGLPPTDLARVRVGTVAPDFRLADETGGVHQLSHHRGKNVVLVVYRGHW